MAGLHGSGSVTGSTADSVGANCSFRHNSGEPTGPADESRRVTRTEQGGTAKPKKNQCRKNNTTDELTKSPLRVLPATAPGRTHALHAGQVTHVHWIFLWRAATMLDGCTGTRGKGTPHLTLNSRGMSWPECVSVVVRVPQHGVRFRRVSQTTLAYVLHIYISLSSYISISLFIHSYNPPYGRTPHTSNAQNRKISMDQILFSAAILGESAIYTRIMGLKGVSKKKFDVFKV